MSAYDFFWQGLSQKHLCSVKHRSYTEIPESICLDWVLTCAMKASNKLEGYVSKSVIQIWVIIIIIFILEHKEILWLSGIHKNRTICSSTLYVRAYLYMTENSLCFEFLLARCCCFSTILLVVSLNKVTPSHIFFRFSGHQEGGFSMPYWERMKT